MNCSDTALILFCLIVAAFWAFSNYLEAKIEIEKIKKGVCDDETL